jgi:hypothetical protein
VLDGKLVEERARAERFQTAAQEALQAADPACRALAAGPGVVHQDIEPSLCGKPVAKPGGPYCAEHTRIAWSGRR